MPTQPLPQFEIFNCEFTSPKTWENIMPESKTDFWNYSEFICWSNKSELIENTTTGAEFYVVKSLTYGEAMILWFLTIFTIILLFKTAYNFFWGK